MVFPYKIKYLIRIKLNLRYSIKKFFQFKLSELTGHGAILIWLALFWNSKILLGRWISEVTKIAEFRLFIDIQFITSIAFDLVFVAFFPKYKQQSIKLFFSGSSFLLIIFFRSTFFTIGVYTGDKNFLRKIIF